MVKFWECLTLPKVINILEIIVVSTTSLRCGDTHGRKPEQTEGAEYIGIVETDEQPGEWIEELNNPHKADYRSVLTSLMPFDPSDSPEESPDSSLENENSPRRRGKFLRKNQMKLRKNQTILTKYFFFLQWKIRNTSVEILGFLPKK